MIGYIKSGSISGSHSTGSVTGAGYVGGLIGCNKGTISNCYSSGNTVTSSGSYVGGLCGFNSASVYGKCENITVKVDNQSRIYGNVNPTTGTVTVTGGILLNGDTLGVASVSSNATWTIGAGQPDYGVTCTGLVAGDTAAILGTLDYTTTCADPSLAGQYEIRVSGPVETTNCVVSYINGVLTVSAPVAAPVDTKYAGALATLLGTKNESSFMETGDFQLNILGRGVKIDDNDFLKFLSSVD
jgi:hypothetical protein